MASEWREATFGQLIQAGALEVGDGYRAKNSELGGDGPIFMRAGHVRDTHIDLDGVERFHRELAAAVAPKMSRLGDVVVTTKGNSTGRTAFMGDEQPPVVYSPHLSYWRSRDPDVVVPGFLRYWARSQQFRNQLGGLAGSTDMAPYISLVDQKRLRILLPPPPEQRSIAAILAALDDKIDVNRRMGETLEGTARTLFKSWFVDFAPVHAKARGLDPGLPAHLDALFPDSLEESDMGEIPAGWSLEPLTAFADLNPESWSDRDAPTEIEYVDLTGIKWGVIEAIERIRWENAPIRARRIVRSGDTIVGTVRPGNGSYALVGTERLTASTGFAALRPRDAILAEYVYLTATAPKNIERLANLADGAAYPAVRPDVVAATVVARPDARLITEFSRRIHPLMRRVADAWSESRTLAAVRDVLLPKLISGELRIGDPARATALDI